MGRNESLMHQLLTMQEEEKQREEEMQKLKNEVKRLNLKCSDETQFEQWRHDQVAELKRWGITKMKDFKFLQREITKLVAGKAKPGASNIAMIDTNAFANEGADAAPTAFV